MFSLGLYAGRKQRVMKSRHFIINDKAVERVEGFQNIDLYKPVIEFGPAACKCADFALDTIPLHGIEIFPAEMKNKRHGGRVPRATGEREVLERYFLPRGFVIQTGFTFRPKP